MIINLDGTKVKVIPPDLDGDGETGGVEKVSQKMHNSDIIPIKQGSELGDSLDVAFSDNFDVAGKVSDIDMKANLHPAQIPYIVIFDSLCKMGFLHSKGLGLSRQVKRLSVSTNIKGMGVGRKNIVEMVTGKREHDKMTSEKAQGFVVGEDKK